MIIRVSAGFAPHQVERLKQAGLMKLVYAMKDAGKVSTDQLAEHPGRYRLQRFRPIPIVPTRLHNLALGGYAPANWTYLEQAAATPTAAKSLGEPPSTRP